MDTEECSLACSVSANVVKDALDFNPSTAQSMVVQAHFQHWGVETVEFNICTQHEARLDPMELSQKVKRTDG